MPDWTYHTIFKPALTRMPYRAAEKLVFGSMGILARTPPGRLLVRMMGHGSPSAAMLVERGSHRFAAPTALGCGVDSCVRGTNAIALFWVWVNRDRAGWFDQPGNSSNMVRRWID